jgi:hypothetical protein
MNIGDGLPASDYEELPEHDEATVSGAFINVNKQTRALVVLGDRSVEMDADQLRQYTFEEICSALGLPEDAILQYRDKEITRAEQEFLQGTGGTPRGILGATDLEKD